MLYSIQVVLSKDNLKSAMVLTVIQFHFTITAYCCMLQTIVDGTVNVVLCSGVILDTIYCMLYIELSTAQLCFARLLIEKELLWKPLLSVNNFNLYTIFIPIPDIQSHT